ncbi:MAG: hypothetical protein K9I94_02835 [Bacteroidales bacterium]|nr:hypothetical protein [Bacteroidales bacterium]
MKHTMFKFRQLLPLMLLAFLTSAAFAQEDFKRTVEKEFDVNKNALLKVENKFGKIHCENWNQNKVYIEVTFSIENASERKAERFFEKVDVEFSADENLVEAETHLKFDDNGDHEFSIDYMVKLPKSMSVELENKFGDIFLDKQDGRVDIDLAYGALDAGMLNHTKNYIEISFGSAEIDFIAGGQFDTKYSEISVEESKELEIDTKFSEWELGKLDILKLDAGYEEFDLEEVDVIDLEASFSEVTIHRVKSEVVAELKYGEIEIKQIDKGFKRCELDNAYAELNIGLEKGAYIQLDAEIKMGSLDYPKDDSNITVTEESFTEDSYKGTIGKGGSPSTMIIESKNGGVQIYFK